MQVQPRVLIVGCGAVGTMAAFTLQKSGIPQITAVIRSKFDVVEAQGFHIVSIDHGTVDGWRPHISRS